MNKLFVFILLLTNITSTSFSMLTRFVQNSAMRNLKDARGMRKHHNTVKNALSWKEKNAKDHIKIQKYFKTERDKAARKHDRLTEGLFRVAEKLHQQKDIEEQYLLNRLQFVNTVKKVIKKTAPYGVRHTLLQAMENRINSDEYSTLSEKQKVKKVLKDTEIFIAKHYKGDKEALEDKIITEKAFEQIEAELNEIMFPFATSWYI